MSKVARYCVDEKWFFFLYYDLDSLHCMTFNNKTHVFISTSFCMLFRLQSEGALGSKFKLDSHKGLIKNSLEFSSYAGSLVETG
jgi:hypothetical protein